MWIVCQADNSHDMSSLIFAWIIIEISKSVVGYKFWMPLQGVKNLTATPKVNVIFGGFVLITFLPANAWEFLAN